MRRPHRSTWVLALVLTAGCAWQADYHPPLADKPPLPSVAGRVIGPRPIGLPYGRRDDGSIEVRPGVLLRPGDDGRIPVRVSWQKELPGVDGIAYDAGEVFVATEVVYAFDAATGTVRWGGGYPTDDALEADGVSYLGTIRGGRVIEAWSPWNYDVRIRRSTGEVLRAGGPIGPPTMTPLPTPRVTRYRIVRNGEGNFVALDPRSRRVAWRFDVPESWYYSDVAAMAIPGGLVLLPADGSIVALRYSDLP